MNWLKNNYGYILLAISLGLNCYCFFYKQDTTKEDLKIQENTTKIIDYQNYISKQDCIIDSISKLKRKSIVIFRNTTNERNEKTNNYYNYSDSVRIYTGAKRTINYTIPK